MTAIRYILDFQWAANIPDAGVRGLYLAFFAAVLVFVLRQKREYVYEGAPDQARWRDLRIWAVAVLVLQAGIYMVF